MPADVTPRAVDTAVSPATDNLATLGRFPPIDAANVDFLLPERGIGGSTCAYGLERTKETGGEGNGAPP